MTQDTLGHNLPFLPAGDPLLMLDSVLIGLTVTTMACTFFGWVTDVHWDTRAHSKPSMFSWISCSWISRRIPPENNGATSERDFPTSQLSDTTGQWAGTESFNVEGFVKAFESSYGDPNRPGNSLAATALRILLPDLMCCNLMQMTRVAAPFVQAYLIACITAYVQSPTNGYLIALKLFLLGFIQLMAQPIDFQASRRNALSAIKVTSAVSVLVVRKVRKLSPSSYGRFDSAKVKQMLSDLDIHGALAGAVSAAGSRPFQGLRGVLISALLFPFSLWQLVQLYGVQSVSTGIITLGMISYWKVHCQDYMTKANNEITDIGAERLGLLEELTKLFDELKCYHWCKAYLKPLNKTTRDIYQYDKTIGVWNGLKTVADVKSLFNISMLVCSCVFLGHPLSIEKFILAQVWSGILDQSMGDFLAVNEQRKEIHRVLDKVEHFLKLEERSDITTGQNIECRGCTFSYPIINKDGDIDSWGPALLDIDLQIPKGELVVISGPVGSGKSSLLKAMLGDLECTAGEFSVLPGEVGYLPQNVVLFDASIRENVLCGIDPASPEFDQHDFDLALEVAQLSDDMANPDCPLSALGDSTQVGLRGSEVSGGQRARIALARSVFATSKSGGSAEAVFLDDPLAAVDNAVTEAAWKASILETMADITRVVAVSTQLIHLAYSADRVILLDKSRVVFNGTPEEMEATDALGQLGISRKTQSSTSQCTAVDSEPAGWFTKPVESIPAGTAGWFGAKSLPTGSNMLLRMSTVAGTNASLFQNASAINVIYNALPLADFVCECGGLQTFIRESNNEPHKGLTLTHHQWGKLQDHLRSISHHSSYNAKTTADGDELSNPMLIWTLYRRSLRFTILVMLCNFIAQAAQPMAIEMVRRRDDGEWDVSALTAIVYFAAFACGAIMLKAASAVFQSIGDAANALEIRDEMDQTLVSLSLPFKWRGGTAARETLYNCVNAKLGQFGAITAMPGHVASMAFSILVVTTAKPTLLPLVLGAMWAKDLSQATFKWAMKNCYAHVGTFAAQTLCRFEEEVDCRLEIRSLRREAHFDQIMRHACFKPLAPLFYAWCANGWTMFLGNLIDASFVIAAMAVVSVIKQQGGSAGVAVVLYQIITGLSGQVSTVLMFWSIANQILEKYRILYNFIKTDLKEDDEGEDPPASWPSTGKIEFEQIRFRYVPHKPIALKIGTTNEATLTIHGGEKVGVVGPPGAGKSSLIKILFRLGPLHGVAPSSGGYAFIDGIDISTLKLAAVRKALGYVPQSPITFAGTLYENFYKDSTNASEAAACKILAACGLSKIGTLDALGQQMASLNLTEGEVQLLAAAKALVKKPQVVVLDEATSALGQVAADHLIRVIDHEAADATVLSIAHRIKAVLHYDRILVLKHGGKVDAFDTPAALKQQDGYFARQVAIEEKK